MTPTRINLLEIRRGGQRGFEREDVYGPMRRSNRTSSRRRMCKRRSQAGRGTRQQSNRAEEERVLHGAVLARGLWIPVAAAVCGYRECKFLTGPAANQRDLHEDYRAISFFSRKNVDLILPIGYSFASVIALPHGVDAARVCGLRGQQYHGLVDSSLRQGQFGPGKTVPVTND
jgi:hypothetical protein